MRFSFEGRSRALFVGLIVFLVPCHCSVQGGNGGNHRPLQVMLTLSVQEPSSFQLRGTPLCVKLYICMAILKHHTISKVAY